LQFSPGTSIALPPKSESFARWLSLALETSGSNVTQVCETSTRNPFCSTRESHVNPVRAVIDSSNGRVEAAKVRIPRDRKLVGKKKSESRRVPAQALRIGFPAAA
jgi:hypothetical protein